MNEIQVLNEDDKTELAFGDINIDEEEGKTNDDVFLKGTQFYERQTVI